MAGATCLYGAVMPRLLPWGKTNSPQLAPATIGLASEPAGYEDALASESSLSAAYAAPMNAPALAKEIGAF